MNDFDELNHNQKHNLELILIDLFSEYAPEIEPLRFSNKFDVPNINDIYQFVAYSDFENYLDLEFKNEEKKQREIDISGLNRQIDDLTNQLEDITD